MTQRTRMLVRLLAALLAVAVPAASALALHNATPAAAEDTTAVAINTRDGASIFRLAFHVRRVANGVVDQGNAAVAVSSCAECETVALAFQAVLVFGDVDTATPENLALAYNVECSSCLTYAAATQLVLGFEGPVRFTAEGNRRLAELRVRLRSLQQDDTLTIEELEAAVEDARAELRDILATEVAPAGEGATTTTTTTTTTSTTTSTTTADDETGTTTTQRTTTTTDPPATTTTAPTTTTEEP